jgi:hypothetical protein
VAPNSWGKEKLVELDDIAKLTRRVERMEDIEAIRQLKARYLNACDRQDPLAVRACFADGEVSIEVGHLGVYDTADAFVAMFTQAGCHDFVLDKHQGGNAEIDIVGDSHAKALWCLDYRNINTRDRTLTLLSLLYHDEYEKIGGAWKIRRTRSEFKTALHCTYAAGMLEPLIAGHSVADAPLAKAR